MAAGSVRRYPTTVAAKVFALLTGKTKSEKRGGIDEWAHGFSGNSEELASWRGRTAKVKNIRKWFGVCLPH